MFIGGLSRTLAFHVGLDIATGRNMVSLADEKGDTIVRYNEIWYLDETGGLEKSSRYR